MYDCPNGCVKEGKMVFWNNVYTCPECGIKGKWYKKRKLVNKDWILNEKGHPYVEWEDGRETINGN